MRPHAWLLGIVLLLVAALPGCLDAHWENVDPHDIGLSLDPDPPRPGEPLTVTATAPVPGNLLLGAMSFDGAGSRGAEGIGTNVSTTFDEVSENDLFVYWAGAYHRDENGTVSQRFGTPQAQWTGAQEERLDVRLQVNASDEPGTGLHLSVHTNTTDLEVTGMVFARSGSGTISQPGAFDIPRTGNGTHETTWGAPSAPSQDPGSDAVGTFTVAVLAQDPSTGAIGYAMTHTHMPMPHATG